MSSCARPGCLLIFPPVLPQMDGIPRLEPSPAPHWLRWSAGVVSDYEGVLAVDVVAGDVDRDGLVAGLSDHAHRGQD